MWQLMVASSIHHFKSNPDVVPPSPVTAVQTFQPDIKDQIAAGAEQHRGAVLMGDSKDGGMCLTQHELRLPMPAF